LGERKGEKKKNVVPSRLGNRGRGVATPVDLFAVREQREETEKSNDAAKVRGGEALSPEKKNV